MYTCPQEEDGTTDFGPQDTNTTEPASCPASHDWEILVDRVRQGDREAMEQLYVVFERGVRFHFYRQLGAQDLEDKLHDTFLIVVQAIQRGELREPERLLGFVRTIVRRQVAAHIDSMVHGRRDCLPIDSNASVKDRARTPEETVINQEKVDLMVKVLRTMSPRDREILTRFYLEEQSQEQICDEMNLTATQFRLLKSRAKARFGELGQRRLERKGSFLRFFGGSRH
jgi:RNA polymerase sigma factor (sigma-70 family)